MIPKYSIDSDYIDKLDVWLGEHGITDFQRMQIISRLTLEPIEENHCDKVAPILTNVIIGICVKRASHTPAKSEQEKVLDILHDKVPTYPSDLGDMMLVSDIEEELRKGEL